MTRVAVIMAGGSGERFWPLSRAAHPKQLLRLTDPDKTMLHEAVDRLAPMIPPERIFVVTGGHLVDAIRAGHVGIPDTNVVAEPCKRNTAGCLVYAAAVVQQRLGLKPEELSMAVVTADHQIGDADRFRETVDAALSVAEEQGALTTHGIVPTRPETGYGYIQASSFDAPLAETNGVSVLPVAAFHEKPDRDTAQKFLDAGNYFWNSGMFFWRLDSFWSELDAAQPAMAETGRAIEAALRAGDQAKADTLFEGLESVSIDYALMEKAAHVAVARADYAWDDVGAWPALDRTRKQDAAGNVLQGDPVVVDSTNCIVYNDAGAEKMAVGVVGMDDAIVVVSGDAVLVIKKDRAQDVRAVVEELKRRNAKQL